MALAALAGSLALAAPASAAPPAISGSDDDAWNAPPSYVVTGDAVGESWQWNLRGPTPLRGGVSRSSPFEVRPEGLRDGAYVLQVRQDNRRGVRPPTETAERRFVVDTVAPRAPELLGPSSAAEGEPVAVAWAGVEARAVVTWSVVSATPAGAEGTPVQGPVDTTAPSVVLTGLPRGAYEVRATQRDRAGNVGPAARLPLTVTAAPPARTPAPPADPAAPPSVAPAAAPPVALPPTTLRLPARNAARLRPGRAATVAGVRPVLRWTPGARGTTFYNVQLFRVRLAAPGRASSSTASLRKVASAFPRVSRMRAPRLARGACYVWRVWPYRGGRYTPRPLGVSHFCVARAPASR